MLSKEHMELLGGVISLMMMGKPKPIRRRRVVPRKRTAMRMRSRRNMPTLSANGKPIGRPRTVKATK